MKKLLLHSCCAPCSGAVLEWLLENDYQPVLFFSNSNIDTDEEYRLRRDELTAYAARMSVEAVDDVYDHEAWLEAIKGLEQEAERGRRCEKCFRMRLDRAAKYAAEHGFTLMATTLASSRWKPLDKVNAAGEEAVRGCPGLEFWAANWRKGGLQERRADILRREAFYNQNYCGCEFSHRK